MANGSNLCQLRERSTKVGRINESPDLRSKHKVQVLP